ncbi:MAG: hypothetical protein QME58_11205 [Bacteroidota bacterium]|nr:hypothetical protein [Bacteroidota bacterium]
MEIKVTHIHINEIELEKLALDTVEGNPTDIYKTDEHLKTCLSCKKKYEYFLNFYANLKEELKKPADARVTELIDKLSSSNIIYLKPYSAQPDLESIGVGKNSYVLAAQTVEENVVRYKTTATFAAEHVHALVKINEDADKKLYRIFVLSENEDHRSHILIGIAEEEIEELLIPTNRDGFAELPYSNPINWRNATLILMTPSEVIAYDDLEKKSGEMIRGLFKFNIKTEERRLTFNFLPETKYLPHHILSIYEDQSYVCKPVEGSATTFPFDPDKKIKEIKFFA